MTGDGSVAEAPLRRDIARDGRPPAAGGPALDAGTRVDTRAELHHHLSAHPGATLLVTDSNRNRGERWTTVRHTRGFTEKPGEEPLESDPTDNRLPTFPDEPDDAMTVSAPGGGVEARATSYGNPITFTSEERPSLAVDGDMETAWRTAAFSDARGERIELSSDDVGGSSAAAGEAVFRSWVLPFEVLSVLLLAALVGAIVVSRPDVGVGRTPRPRSAADDGPSPGNATPSAGGGASEDAAAPSAVKPGGGE